LRRCFDQAAEPFGLTRNKRRAPLHRNPAPDRPQSGEQPERRKQAQSEERARRQRHQADAAPRED